MSLAGDLGLGEKAAAAALSQTRDWMRLDASAPCLLGLSFLICNSKGLDEKPQGSPSTRMAKETERKVVWFPGKCWHEAAPNSKCLTSSFKPSPLMGGRREKWPDPVSPGSRASNPKHNSGSGVLVSNRLCDLWLTLQILCRNKMGTEELVGHHRLPGLAESPLTFCLEARA